MLEPKAGQPGASDSITSHFASVPSLDASNASGRHPGPLGIADSGVSRTEGASELPPKAEKGGHQKQKRHPFPYHPAPSSPTKGECGCQGLCPLFPHRAIQESKAHPPQWTSKAVGQGKARRGEKTKDFRGPQLVSDYVTWLTREGRTVRLMSQNPEYQEAELPGPKPDTITSF